MDYLDDLGNLALASRLKRLSERLAQEVAEVYKEQGIDFEPRWFSVFRFIAERAESSVTDIALAVGLTHPAIIQICEELTSAGLLSSVTGSSDRRKRMLSLSSEGKRIKQQLEPVWKVLHASLSEVSEEIENDLVNISIRYESSLNSKSLTQRFAGLKETVLHSKPQVIEYSAEYAHHFARLNRIWIEKYFCLEQADLQVLGDPQKIVDNGGFIFFAKMGQKIVGTGALLKTADRTFEVVKMAVDEAYQGNGLGAMLLEKCIERARFQGADELLLETNTMLKSAVHLYKKLGFQECTENHQSKYSRVNLIMKLDLNSSSSDRLRSNSRAPLSPAASLQETTKASNS